MLKHPAAKTILKELLGFVIPLTAITHFVLLDLNYPANLADFFSQIFPLISFDLFDTTELYEIVFSVSDFVSEPKNEQFELLGYGG